MAGQSTSARRGANSEIWTTRQLLKWMSDHFAAKAVESPLVVAEMLLAHVLSCERMRLYMEVDRPASATELARLRELVIRATKHEPAQYLVGHAWFFGRQFQVNRCTLIPRPCTETLVEHVLHWHRLHPGHAAPLIGDVGTGTGCIAISLAAQIADSHVIATDTVPEALGLAKMNAQKHKVADRIEFRQGAGIPALKLGTASVASQMAGMERGPYSPSFANEGLCRGTFDIIASNPPYIPDREWETSVGRNVKEYEPVSALRGGADGLDVIRPLIAQAPAVLKPGGLLAVEIADCQRDQVMTLASATGLFANVNVQKDHEGLWRVLTAERK
jgi:release factor glutamine methyltransferase